MHLSMWDMESRLGVLAKFRFPFFRPLMWHTARRLVEGAPWCWGTGRVVRHTSRTQSWPGSGLPTACVLSVQCRQCLLASAHSDLPDHPVWSAGTCEALDVGALKALAQQLASWLRVPTPGCPGSIHDPAGLPLCTPCACMPVQGTCL